MYQIDHENLETRTWVCKKCGCKCLSKNPWQRNTHGESPGGLTGAMYLGHLNHVSTAKMGTAKPPRLKEEAQIYMSNQGYPEVICPRDTPFCFIDHEQDIVINITPDINVADTGKPILSNGEQLLKFFKIIRGADWEVLQAYACAQLNGGHSWTDDPEELAKVKKEEDD